MIVLQPAKSHKPSQGRIGLAIAGGGPIGGMYELGALRALERAIDGIDLTRLEVYVGVSSGAFLASSLANGIDTAEICRIFLTNDSKDVRFRPQMFLRPAFGEYMKRAVALPRITLDWWRDMLCDPAGPSASELLGRLSEAIPTGVFDNRGIESFLRKVFTAHGRSNDFRELARKLYVIAVDLDSGEAIRFGSKGWDDIEISHAVQASSALPGLYPPVDIRGRHFVDGALRRTMHASVVLDHGIDLLLGINPFVPFNASHATLPVHGKEKLAQGGLPVVLSQTFRTLLQSRVQVGLAKYAQQYPDTDQIVFEPNEDDGEMFFTNVFSYASRQRVCEHAFQTTLADLKKHRKVLTPLLALHGLSLRDEILDDPDVSILDGVTSRRHDTPTTEQLRSALNRVDHLLQTRDRQKPKTRARPQR